MDARETVARHAALAERRLPATILPYWLRSVDEEHGGYRLHDDVLRSWPRRAVGHLRRRSAPPDPDDKQLVDQARLVWVCAHAHRKGLVDGDVALRAASSGYEFLHDHFLDPVHGGYVWTTDRAGRVVNPVKHLYGQAFVILALVEHARASGTTEPIDRAVALHRTVERELHDDLHGGWREHGDADWGPLHDHDPRIAVPSGGSKTGDAVLHWIEALAELSAERVDPDVRRSLQEALDLARWFLYPPDPAGAFPRRRTDWTLDPDVDHTVSHGHNVEFAWMVVRAEQVLGLEPSWAQCHAYVDHTLRHGFDDRRGGVLTPSRRDRPGVGPYKVWWTQCELVVALLEASAHRADERYLSALALTLEFVERHMVDPRDGVMVEEVEADGRRRAPRKSGHWKAGYHEVRAAVRLAEAPREAGAGLSDGGGGDGGAAAA